MIAKHLLVPFSLSSRRVNEPSCKDVEDARLEEDQFLPIVLANGAIKFFICRQQVFVIGLAGKKKICGVAVETCPCGLVDKLIPE
jgi:hypothetical protein